MALRRATASFRVMGQALDPTQVSETLGMPPADSHRRGDKNISRSGRQFSDFSVGLWSLKSTAAPESGVDAHIRSIVDQLNGKGDAIERLKQQGLRVDIFVGVFGEDEMLSFSLEEETLRLITQLNVRIDFDVYA